MNLQCPYEGCYRTFAKQQALSQHIRNRHTIIENEINVNDDDADFFQDEKFFEDLDLLKVDFVFNQPQCLLI
jgi:hypothetical protein